jgi:hypothetical protein
MRVGGKQNQQNLFVLFLSATWKQNKTNKVCLFCFINATWKQENQKQTCVLFPKGKQKAKAQENLSETCLKEQMLNHYFNQDYNTL